MARRKNIREYDGISWKKRQKPQYVMIEFQNRTNFLEAKIHVFEIVQSLCLNWINQ